jgi:peptidoglycan/LPS O-acetylase OafA/YrhL
MSSFARYRTAPIEYLRDGFRDLWNPPRRHIPALDALRAIAVLLVLCTHWANPEFSQAGGHVSEVEWLTRLPMFYYGWAGVDLFFVLSGFLIGAQLWREIEQRGTVDYSTFFLRRSYRIWPLYFAMLIYYSVASDRIHPRLVDWFFLSNYWPGGVARGWSLSTEEQFYLAAPLLLIALGRRVAFRYWLWVLFGIECAVLTVRASTIRHLPFAATGTDFILIYPIHTHLEGLLAGLLLAWAGVRWPTLYRIRTEKTPVWSVFAGAIATVAIAGVLHSVQAKLFAWLVWALVFGAATIVALIDQSWLTNWMRWRVWFPLSRLTYGIYLNHFWVLPWVSIMVIARLRRATSHESVVFLGALGSGIVVSVTFATVTFLLIERPFLQVRERHMTSRRAQSA